MKSDPLPHSWQVMDSIAAGVPMGALSLIC
jgi:aspartokinase-like uncharacterized kinase